MCPNAIYSNIEQSSSSFNPYEDYSYSTEIECNYCIPTPDFFVTVCGAQVPPPIDLSAGKFTYTLKNGKTLELDHPLPPGFPIDLIGQEEEPSQDNAQIDSSEGVSSFSEILMYGAICVCPIAGLILYAYHHKKHPKLAQKLRYMTFTSFVTMGTILLLIL